MGIIGAVVMIKQLTSKGYFLIHMYMDHPLSIYYLFLEIFMKQA